MVHSQSIADDDSDSTDILAGRVAKPRSRRVRKNLYKREYRACERELVAAAITAKNLVRPVHMSTLIDASLITLDSEEPAHNAAGALVHRRITRTGRNLLRDIAFSHINETFAKASFLMEIAGQATCQSHHVAHAQRITELDTPAENFIAFARRHGRTASKYMRISRKQKAEQEARQAARIRRAVSPDVSVVD